MNFTREPIIESVITPRDGCKLILRNSKGGGQEEYIVEAVEVVSFGRSIFYRSVEAGKSFFLPVTDYEVIESKEVRMALKNVQADRQIKIGGGREAQLRPQQQQRRPESSRESSDVLPSDASASVEPQQDRKRDRRRRGRRGRGGGDRSHDMQHQEGREYAPVELSETSSDQFQGESALQSEEESTPKAPSFISKLFPPPTTLIKDTISRYKTVEEMEIFPEVPGDKPSLEETMFDHPLKGEKDEDIHLEDQ